MKTKCMIFRSSTNKAGTENMQYFRINNNNIEFVKSFRYLGYIISNDFNCNDDITRARNNFYAQFNMLLRKFSFSNPDVKCFYLDDFACKCMVVNCGSMALTRKHYLRDLMWVTIKLLKRF